MSSSVLFLVAAVGLSFLGTVAVWLHGRPRRPKSSVDHFAQNLRALSSHRGLHEPPSGVTPLRPQPVRPVAPVVEPAPVRVARPARRSPRPSPRSSAEGTRPGS